MTSLMRFQVLQSRIWTTARRTQRSTSHNRL